MARKRRSSKTTMGQIYLVVLGMMFFFIAKAIAFLREIPWQFWVGTLCLIVLVYAYRYNRRSTSKPITKPSQSSKVSPVQPKPTQEPSLWTKPVPQPVQAPEQPSANQGSKSIPVHAQEIKLTATDLMISGTSTPFPQDLNDANSLGVVKAHTPIKGQVPSFDFEDKDEDGLIPMRTTGSQQANEFVISFSLEDSGPVFHRDAKEEPLYRESELMVAGPSMVGRWMSPGEQITLAGLRIDGGMFYVGNTKLSSSLVEEPSLINPQSPVTIENAPSDLPLPGYFPNYKELSPKAKKRYLQWLAGGRKDPDVAIGFVFIFFYGLERRYFIDAKHDELAKREMPFIHAEVARLLSIYSENDSFASYATGFLEYGFIKNIDRQLYLFAAQEAEPTCYHVPISLKICLGQLVRDGKPVPADWALLWAMSTSMLSVKTPVRRCFDIFKAMFFDIYKKHYGDGFKLKELKTRVEISYIPASYAVSRFTERHVTNLSNVVESQPNINKLNKVVSECTELLEPYSRYLGRNPGSELSLGALLLLPHQYWPSAASEAFVSLQHDVGEHPLMMPWSEFLSRNHSSGNFNKAQYEGLTAVLANYQLSIEPHPEGSNKRPKGDESVVIYPINPNDKADRNPSGMATVSAFVDMACVVLNTDEDKSEVTIAFLKEQIGSMTFLTQSQSVRLVAKALLGTQVPPTLSIVKKTIDSLDDEQKALVGKLLVAFVKADNSITPAKVKILEQLYKLISLDVKQVYSDLHSNEARIVSTTKSGNVANSSTGTSSLDMARVQQLKQETSQVTAMLASVFTEDDGEHDDIHQPQQANADAVSAQVNDSTDLGSSHSLFGLDDDLSQFLKALLARPEWARDDLSALADTMGLMLDGALEQINEVMLDHFDEMLIEGDDPIELNTDLLEQIPHE